MATYKAIVFDLDGTAIPNSPDGMPSPRVVEAVSKAKGNMRLIAATARPLSIALPVIQALGLEDPCVICGGTLVVNPSGDTVHEARLTKEQIRSISKVCASYPYKIGLDNDRPGDGGTPDKKLRIDKANIIFIQEVESRHLTSIIQSLSNIPGVFATSTKSWTTGHVVHITTRDGSKEHGIARVLKQLCVAREEAIGVGDGDNDIHLFAAVGHRIAMGNASEQLKSVADEIAPSVDEDGLAWVINRYKDQ